MKEAIIKTYQWTDEKLDLFKKCARLCQLGSPRNKKPDNFVKFFNAYIPNATLQSILKCVEMTEKYVDYSNPDVTHITTFAEDSCLFSTEGDAASALEIVLCHLDNLGHGMKVPAFWCFLDEEMKAVVHFVNKKGYYAELYCLADENSSALHLIEYKGKKYIVPVVFTAIDDFERFWTVANALGGYCLRDYLPRVKFDFLSKKGKNNKKDTTTEASKQRGSGDDWDTL